MCTKQVSVDVLVLGVVSAVGQSFAMKLCRGIKLASNQVIYPSPVSQLLEYISVFSDSTLDDML